MSENRPARLPTGWQSASLAEVALIVRGVTFPKSDRHSSPDDGFVACLRTANVQELVEWSDLWYIPVERVRRDEQLVLAGDTLISTANSLRLVGKVALVRHVPVASTLGAFISLIRPLDILDPSFMYYQLSSLDIQNSFRTRASTTTNISNISSRVLSETGLLIPPLNEQRRIVDKIEALFSELDAGVAALERAQAQLERYRQSVLKAAFEGRLTAAWRAEHAGEIEPAEALLERIAVEREAREQEEEAQGKRRRRRKALPPLDTSELPELPEGWCWARLGELGILDRGKSRHRPRNAPHLYGGPYPFVQTGDVKAAQGVLTEYSQTYSEEGLAQSRLWPKGTLCITIAANIAQTAILGLDACFPDSVVGFLPERPMGDANYVELFFRDAQSEIERYAPATAQKNINLAILNDLAVPVAPIAEQAEIVRRLERRLETADRVEADISVEVTRASRLRQAILKRAFEGRLVPQDPSDEPASALLERIRAARAEEKPARRKRRARKSKQERLL